MKRSRIVRRAVAAILMLCLLVTGLTSCADDTSEPTPKNVSRTVTVQTAGGMPLEGVRLKVYSDTACTKMVWAADTDENGSTTFTAPDTVLTVTPENVPEGYDVAVSYPVSAHQAVITVASSLLPETALSEKTFRLGDVMCDFTVSTGTDTSGDPTSSVMDSYTLSALLKEKKAVVLNFWFENCDPCRMEFPYLQEAYEAYADEVAVLALNPYDGSMLSVAAYAAKMGLTFPVVKAEEVWASAMALSAYPTTVVIDRYGMIAMVHKGAITEAGTFEAILAYFIADDYVQGTVRSVQDLL